MSVFDFVNDNIDNLKLGDVMFCMIDEGWCVQVFTSRPSDHDIAEFDPEVAANPDTFINCGAWFIASPEFETREEAVVWYASNAEDRNL